MGAAQWIARLILLAILALCWYEWPPRSYWAMWLSAIGWIVFTVYWGIAARSAGAAKSSESGRSRLIHVVLLNGGILMLFISFPGLRQDFLPPIWGWGVLGLMIQFSFFRFGVWARTHLGVNWSARVEVKENPELVRSGPYKKLRHPIYTAVLGMAIGTAIVSGKVHALVGVAMLIVAYFRKIRIVEATLRQTFGSQYDDYRRETWGMIPGLF
jgi:protein-S-isoprenylcysteine O-methyltransferase Ste14